MSERKLIVLGTASQVPGRNRSHGGYFLRFDEQGLLFDPGEGTQRQMIHAGVSVSEITKIFISHFHGDHCLGLAGIIQRISLDKVPHEIKVFYPASGRKYYLNMRDACSFYNIARLEEHPISSEGVVFEDEKMLVEARRLDHDIETFGYRLSEKDSFTLIPERLKKSGIVGKKAGELKRAGSVLVGGQRIDIRDVGVSRPGQVFAHVMDTRLCQAAYDLAHGADLLLCEATYLSDLEETARLYGHLTAAQAGQIARDSSAGLLVLTHFSQRYTAIEDFEKESGLYHDNVIAARDGDHIPMPVRKRTLSP